MIFFSSSNSVHPAERCFRQYQRRMGDIHELQGVFGGFCGMDVVFKPLEQHARKIEMRGVPVHDDQKTFLPVPGFGPCVLQNSLSHSHSFHLMKWTRIARCSKLRPHLRPAPGCYIGSLIVYRTASIRKMNVTPMQAMTAVMSLPPECTARR